MKFVTGWSWSEGHTTERNKRHHFLVLWFYSWSGGNVMTIQEWNDLGLSLCTVPQSPVICCGHVFWSSGMLSEGMVNLGVMELRGI